MTDAPAPRPIAIEEFLPLVGSALHAECEPRSVMLELISVTPLVNHARLDRAPFILVLRSAPDAVLVSASYVLRATGFGPDLVDIIQIAPLPSGAPGHYYQAVFN